MVRIQFQMEALLGKIPEMDRSQEWDFLYALLFLRTYALARDYCFLERN